VRGRAEWCESLKIKMAGTISISIWTPDLLFSICELIMPARYRSRLAKDLVNPLLQRANFSYVGWFARFIENFCFHSIM